MGLVAQGSRARTATGSLILLARAMRLACGASVSARLFPSPPTSDATRSALLENALQVPIKSVIAHYCFVWTPSGLIDGGSRWSCFCRWQHVLCFVLPWWLLSARPKMRC